MCQSLRFSFGLCFSVVYHLVIAALNKTKQKQKTLHNLMALNNDHGLFLTHLWVSWAVMLNSVGLAHVSVVSWQTDQELESPGGLGSLQVQPTG